MLNICLGRIWRTLGFFLFAAFSLSFCPALAADDTNADLIRVPIYFVTDRNLESDSPEIGAKFGPQRKYVGECLHDPFMGVGYCVVKNTQGKQLTQKLLDLGWAAAAPTDKEGFDKAQLITGKTFSEIQSQFFTKIRGDALKSTHKEVLIFAHGYKNSFDVAFHTAARFSYNYENPVILYSWPSVAKLRSYSPDENNNEWSQEHFNDLLYSMEKVCTTIPTVNLRIFAHSMGTRLVVRAAPFLREKPYLVEAGLICPDIDAGLVKHYARRYLSANGTSTIRLYMSQRDKALAFSQIIHGGYCRLGECADSFVSIARGALLTSGKLNKEADDKRFNEIMEKAKHRMQTIDFTVLDSGAFGHKIPVELIREMSYTSTPGPGLEFISQESGQRSRASRILSRLTHLQNDSIFPTDNCLRVAKTDQAKHGRNTCRAKSTKQELSLAPNK